MARTLEATTPDLGAIKQRQQQTWASGDFHQVAAQIVLVAEQLCDTADLHAGWRVLDVATGQRQRRDRGRPARLHGRRRRLRSVPARARPRARGRRGPRRGAARGRRRGAAVPGRLVRRRHVGLRHDVRPRSREDGRRAAPGLPAGRHHRARQLDPRRVHRRAVPHDRRATCPRPPGCARRCSGAPRHICASCSATASPRSRWPSGRSRSGTGRPRTSSSSSGSGTARR